MSLGSRAEPLFTAYTTAILSQRNWTCLPLHKGPHNANATTMGTNSFGLIGVPRQAIGHDSWNHLPSQTAPQPQEPEASEEMVVSAIGGSMRLAPFHSETNTLHQAISALESALSETWWSNGDTDIDASMRLRMNALPGFTTLEVQTAN